MIYIKDDFLDKDFFDVVNDHVNSNEFLETDVGNAFFYTQESNDDFNEYMLSKLEKIEQRKLTNVLAFFRVATDKLDTSWRIHSDLNVNGERPDRAIVLYLSPKERTDLHGTAFWEHNMYGKDLPLGITDDQYDSTINIDANDLDKWSLKSVVGYEPNRLLSYPANHFHSKFPNKGWEEGRKVFVMFYKFQ